MRLRGLTSYDQAESTMKLNQTSQVNRHELAIQESARRDNAQQNEHIQNCLRMRLKSSTDELLINAGINPQAHSPSEVND